MARKGENIFKRRDGRWEARYICRYENGKAKYGYVYAPTYAGARAKKLAAQSAAGTVKKIAVKQLATFETLAKLWLAETKISIKESTYTRYHRILEKYLLPIMGKQILSKIEQRFLNGIAETLLNSGIQKGNLSPKTVADILCVLKSIFRFGKANEFPVPNFNGLKYPQNFPKSIRILTEASRTKLEKEAIKSNDFISLGIILTLFTGIRIGELCGLKWGDIDFVSSFVAIRRTVGRIADLDPLAGTKTKVIVSKPKTKSSIREIPIPDFLLTYLRERRSANDYYILTDDTKCMEPHCFYMWYKRYLKQNGMEDYTFHSLRHTFATRCVELGFDVKSLSEILGHSNITTTLSAYVHPSMRQKKQQMEKLTPH